MGMLNTKIINQGGATNLFCWNLQLKPTSRPPNPLTHLHVTQGGALGSSLPGTSLSAPLSATITPQGGALGSSLPSALMPLHFAQGGTLGSSIPSALAYLHITQGGTLGSSLPSWSCKNWSLSGPPLAIITPLLAAVCCTFSSPPTEGKTIAPRI